MFNLFGCKHEWGKLDKKENSIILACIKCGKIHTEKIECKHKWEVKEEIIVNGNMWTSTENKPVAKIIINRCEKCGEIKTINISGN